MHIDGRPDDLFGERAPAVAEHDLVLVLLDDKEIALDPAFQIDQHIAHLVARQTTGPECRFVTLG